MGSTTRDIIYDREAIEIVRKAIEDKLNILVVGYPGTGKTTLIKNMINMIKHSDSICILEDGNELRNAGIKHPKVARYEIDEHKGGSRTWREGIKGIMKVVPDYCIMEEIRGKEAFEVLETMAAGYYGCIVSMISNSVEEAINKQYPDLASRGDWEFNKGYLYEYISQTFDIIICLGRGDGEERRIQHIAVVDGLKYDKSGNVTGVELIRIWELGD